MAKSPANMSFEQSMTELEKIVTDMEGGELSLEDALKAFERGISLARESQNKLQQAEQKVQILTEQDGQAQLENFEPAIEE